MDRKQFLKSAAAGFCGCGAVLGFGQAIAQWDKIPPVEGIVPELEKRMIKGSESPGWLKAEKAQIWIKSMMEHLDARFDKQTRIDLLQACGHSCFLRAFGVASDEPPSDAYTEKYLQGMKNNGYEFIQEDRAQSFIFSWGRDHQNPQGLIMRDGYCMCNIMENGPPGLSPTFCYCSTGYVREMFQRKVNRPIDVELSNSLKMGGDDCIFKIIIHDA